MSPRKRNKENEGLPNRWRWKNGAYRYQVPPGKEHLWDGKKEFTLGVNLADAHRAFSERIEHPDQLTMMIDMINRYQSEVTPTKAIKTQKDEHLHLELLKKVFSESTITSITTQDCYRLYDSLARKRGLTTANRIMEKLSHVFSKAIRWGARSDHPMTGGKFTKEKPQSTQYVPEAHVIEAALPVAPLLIQLYVELKWKTGLRMTDMLSLKRTDIKEHGIVVTPSKTQKSSGKTVVIKWDKEGSLLYLINEIKAMPQNVKSNYLFCTRRGQPFIKQDKSVNAFQSAWRRWQDKALAQGLIEKRFAEKPIRKRVGSEMETDEDAARLLAHSNVETTRKFYRLNPNEVNPNVKNLSYSRNRKPNKSKA